MSDPVLLALASVVEKRAVLERVEEVLREYHAVFGFTGPLVTVPRAIPAAAPKLLTSGRRARIAPGSVPDRILEVLGESSEPLKLAAILDAAKARPSTVKEALKALVAEKRVVRTGATISLRYSLLGKGSR